MLAQAEGRSKFRELNGREDLTKVRSSQEFCPDWSVGTDRPYNPLRGKE